MDINKELIPTKLDFFCSIGETIITINSSVNNIIIRIQPYIFHFLVDINKKLIYSKLNSPSNIRAMVTPSNITMLSQSFPFFTNTNRDLTYSVNINTLSIYSRVEDRLA